MKLEDNSSNRQKGKAPIPINVLTFGEHLKELQPLIEGVYLKDNFLASERLLPVYLSDSEFAIDIWSFVITDKDEYSFKGLWREGILNKIQSAGYYKRLRKNNAYFFIKEERNIIHVVEPFNIKDEVFNYVKAINEPLRIRYNGLRIYETAKKLREVFLRQSHLIFNTNFLEHLPVHEKEILKDTENEAFFFFAKGISKVTKGGISNMDYSDVVDRCIWKSQIGRREFEYDANFENCHFARFIRNVCNDVDLRKRSLASSIGYILHNYNSPSMGQALILYDEEITDLFNPMGGTGKGILGNAFRELREVAIIDGKKFKADDKFKFQKISESTQITWVDDVKPGFPFAVFNSALTEGWDVERKYEPEHHIDPADGPKLLVTSNSVVDGGGTTSKRRQQVNEFSNYYSKMIVTGSEKPVIIEHGCHFFTDEWDKAEWNKFYSFMLYCVSSYLQTGLIHCESIGVDRNNLIQSTSEDFVAWIHERDLRPGQTYLSRDTYEDFKSSCQWDGDLKQKTFTGWLKKYASIKGWKVEHRHSGNISSFFLLGKRENGSSK